jgi:hypothetical protein
VRGGLAAWRAVFGICAALFVAGFVGFVVLTCADRRYRW